MNLIATLRKLGQQANEQFPYLNHGGCCVYAAEVGRILQTAGMTVRVVSGRPWGWGTGQSIDKVREVLLKHQRNVNSKYNWSSNGIDFYHIAVQVIGPNGKWYSCDSNSCRVGATHFGEGRRMITAPGTGFTVEEAIGFAEEGPGWNDTFDRSLIPHVHKLIRQHLADLLPVTVQ